MSYFDAYKALLLTKIYVDGNIIINTYYSSLGINNVSSYVTIDSEIKECYNGNINFCTNMIGYYLMFFI
ncbi:hypothetical protein CLPUN_12430 [Clostridium puniceum]|uniref:Uncharacterized protein n=1 Tax=Clostridium puniceum TaxID=29367 RepID=A0A1S8TSP9_9CLOT|nr:hypothetical protein CLPUN_12430 [Clostridium puniceum]